MSDNRISVAEWRALAGGAGGARVRSTGARAQEIGARAEADFIASCELLEMQGRVWWLRLPDPLIPHGAPTSAGELLCHPRERDRATDFMGVALPSRVAWAAEVKGFEVDVWRARPALRPAQVRALRELANLDIPCGVYVVHYGARVTRYWLPWLRDRDGLSLDRIDTTAHDAGGAHRLGAQETWLDALERLTPEKSDTPR